MGQAYPIKRVYAVEVSGVCNLEATCKWCPMHNRPRSRPRGLMNEKIVERSLEWVKKLGVPEVLALHNFGEPLLHPKFDEIALRFSKVAPVTMSTNGVLLDESWAERLSKIPWEWISISKWDVVMAERASVYLRRYGLKLVFPPGVIHSFAGQAEGPEPYLFERCPFLNDGSCVIRWDGTVASCCISDRAEDVVGNVNKEPEQVFLREYAICKGCHHGKG